MTPLSVEEATELRRLYISARTVNGTTPMDSASRADSVKLSEMLAELRNRGGVSWRNLDEAMGASYGTARMRLWRHGYGQRPPSLPAYQGVPTGKPLVSGAQVPVGPVAIDLAGQRSGKLTAESRRRPGEWLCRCDCGGQRVVKVGEFQQGKYSDCPSCMARPMRGRNGGAKPKDIRGQRFGMLTIEEMFHTKGQGVKWLCRCDCGGAVMASTRSLRKGERRTCGCRGRALTQPLD